MKRTFAIVEREMRRFRRSPFLIAQPRAGLVQEKIQGILERRRFDQETRRRARQLAGGK